MKPIPYSLHCPKCNHVWRNCTCEVLYDEDDLIAADDLFAAIDLSEIQ